MPFIVIIKKISYCNTTLCPINEVTLRRARLVLVMGDCLRAGKPSQYVTSRLGQLSLPSRRGK